MKLPSHTFTIILFSLATLGLGALAFGSSAVGFITSYNIASDLPRSESVLLRGVVSDYPISDNISQGTFRDPLITLVRPSAPLREDTPYTPTILPTDPTWGEGEVAMVLFCDHLSQTCRNAVTQVSAYIRDNSTRDDLRRSASTDLRSSASYLRPSAYLVWKDFPNPLNPDSRPAALAARCAQNQGKFWEFHEAIVEIQNPKPKTQNYGTIITELGLDLNEFNRCVEERATTDLVNQGMEEAQALDIEGIPTLFVGEYRLTGGITTEEIERLIKL
ncbi:MAG: thioredoxin domain-containing protein [Patescibacteria group bacterium]